jgi:oligopeptide transport system substrate-binding protein
MIGRDGSTGRPRGIGGWPPVDASALAALLLALLIPTVDARGESILRRTLAGEPETLDPQRTGSAIEESVERDLFEGLTALDADGRVIPGIAKSWDVSPDGKQWIFHLREGAAWSNGDRLVAEDFVYSLRRVIDPAVARSTLFDALVGAPEILAGRDKDLTHLGIHAPDDLTVEIDLRRPNPLLAGDLARAQGMPVHRPSIEAHPTNWARPGTLVSNGPFMLVDWVPQSEIGLRRNPHYHAASDVKLDGVDWVITEDAASALKRYRSGELDIANLSPGDLAWARRAMPQDVRVEPGFGTRYLGFNLRAEPLGSNIVLRKALALAIDREILCDRVEPDGRRSADSLVPPGIPGYHPQSLWYHDLAMASRYAEARRLIVEAGYGPDRPLRLSVLYVNDQTYRKILLALAQMWKDNLGVDLILLNQEWQVVLARMRQHDFELTFIGITDDLADPRGFLDAFRRSAGENAIGYDNPAYDHLLDAADGETIESARMRLLERAERILIDDVSLVPLMNPANRTLVRPSVRGWAEAPIGSHPSRYLQLGTRTEP